MQLSEPASICDGRPNFWPKNRCDLPSFYPCSGSTPSTGTWEFSTAGWWRDPRRKWPWRRRGKPTTSSGRSRGHRARQRCRGWSHPSSEPRTDPLLNSRWNWSLLWRAASHHRRHLHLLQWGASSVFLEIPAAPHTWRSAMFGRADSPRVCPRVRAPSSRRALRSRRSPVLSDARWRSRPQNARNLLFVFKRGRTVYIYLDEEHSHDLKPAWPPFPRQSGADLPARSLTDRPCLITSRSLGNVLRSDPISSGQIYRYRRAESVSLMPVRTSPNPANNPSVAPIVQTSAVSRSTSSIFSGWIMWGGD